jgi:2-dehydropantoate 2-reductase
MRALVVGAGAVGQVYARHLAQGGTHVGFLVKRKHVTRTRAGLTLYHLNRPRRQRTTPERLTGYGTFGSVRDAAVEAWDQIYLAMSSPALRAGSWFAELTSAIPDATVVFLQPGPEDREFVLAHAAESRVVQGIITIIGYHAPLPGEVRFPEPGVAYWLPPLAPSPMSGPAARLEPVLRALREGRLPARRVRDVGGRGPFGAAVMMPVLAELESVGWRFDDLRSRGHLRLALRASRQALDIVAHRRGIRAPLGVRLATHAPFVRSGLRLAPAVTPFDFETYIRVHFTKVGDQTRDMLRTYLDWARETGLPTGALERVHARIALPP